MFGDDISNTLGDIEGEHDRDPPPPALYCAGSKLLNPFHDSLLGLGHTANVPNRHQIDEERTAADFYVRDESVGVLVCANQ